jgi:uncharacterized membrane protein
MNPLDLLALGRIPAPAGIAAMQSINIVVINPWFFAAFFGTAVLSIAVLAPESPAAAKYWLDYLSTWTAWNHVRTIAPLVSAALFAWAFRLRG